MARGGAASRALRVASFVAVVIEPGRAYSDVEPRITERYTVSAPLERLEDYAGVLGE